MRPNVQLGLYLFVSSMTSSFVTYTVHATWQENMQGDHTVLVTDIIKVLVLFLQYIVIIGSVSVPWPLSDVQQWLQAIGIVVTMGSGQGLSLDCWLYHYSGHSAIPIAIQRQLVHFLAPVCTFVAVLLLVLFAWALQHWVLPLFRQPSGAARAQRRRQSLWLLQLRKLPVTVLVLVSSLKLGPMFICMLDIGWTSPMLAAGELPMSNPIRYYAFPTLLRASLRRNSG
jgi:hypothetical protein